MMLWDSFPFRTPHRDFATRLDISAHNATQNQMLWPSFTALHIRCQEEKQGSPKQEDEQQDGQDLQDFLRQLSQRRRTGIGFT